MCKEIETTGSHTTYQRYKMLLTMLDSINTRLGNIEQAANNGMTPAQWQSKQAYDHAMRKIDEDSNNRQPQGNGERNPNESPLD